MSPSTKELMKQTLEEKLAHGRHPVLRRMMDNIYIRTDPAGNIKADKEKSTEKIDGRLPRLWGWTGRFGVEMRVGNRFMSQEVCWYFNVV